MEKNKMDLRREYEDHVHDLFMRLGYEPSFDDTNKQIISQLERNEKKIIERVDHLDEKEIDLEYVRNLRKYILSL